MARETEIEAEDEQAFLARMLTLLQQGSSPNLRTESPMRSPAGVQKTGDRRVQGSPSVQTLLSSPKKVCFCLLPSTSYVLFHIHLVFRESLSIFKVI